MILVHTGLGEETQASWNWTPSSHSHLGPQAEPVAALSVPDHEIAAPLPVECGHLKVTEERSSPFNPPLQCPQNGQVCVPVLGCSVMQVAKCLSVVAAVRDADVPRCELQFAAAAPDGAEELCAASLSFGSFAPRFVLVAGSNHGWIRGCRRQQKYRRAGSSRTSALDLSTRGWIGESPNLQAQRRMFFAGFIELKLARKGRSNGGEPKMFERRVDVTPQCEPASRLGAENSPSEITLRRRHRHSNAVRIHGIKAFLTRIS